MRIVVCSDVHGNVRALEAVLADIAREGQPDELFVAGDLALSGPRPAEALALLRSLPGARFVMGNCDEAIVRGGGDGEVAFARRRLSADDIAFLAALPLTQMVAPAPGRELLVCHANPRNLHDHIKPELAEALVRPLLAGVTADVVAFGHYHVPFVRSMPPWTLVDVASVGIPRDGDRRAAYAVISYAGGRWAAEHRRVMYDWDSVAADFAAVGFPGAERAAAGLLRARY